MRHGRGRVMPHDITVGVDGSPAGLAAAHWAAEEARRRGTGLGVVHAWNSHPRPAPYVPMDRTEHDWAAEILHEAVRSIEAAHPDLRVTERLVRDSTVAALVAAAADSEMLVLGSRGLGGLLRIRDRSSLPARRGTLPTPRGAGPGRPGGRPGASARRRRGRAGGDPAHAVPGGRPRPRHRPSLRRGHRLRLRGRQAARHRPAGGPCLPYAPPARLRRLAGHRPRPPPSTRCRTHGRQDRRGRTPNDR
ncbi:universal stress protein [Streptomyces sp. PG2]